MNVLIKSATIIDAKSDYHNKTQDILVEKGVIVNIANSIKNPKNYREIKLDNLHISQGWFDSSVCFGEPGFEERETIANGLKVAAKSGFTAVAVNANTNPVIDSNSDISFLKNKAQGNAVNLLPIGALTKESKGHELAELFDMKTAGAVAFGDYKKALQYLNEVLNDNEQNLRRDIYSFARLFNIVIHYELENYDFLEYVVKSTNRYLSKQERDYQIENVCIKHIRKLSKTIDGVNRLEIFEKMEEEISELLQDHNERVVLEYFNISAWVKSKLNKTGFDQTIKEDSVMKS